MSFLWEAWKGSSALTFPLPKELVYVDNPILLVKRGLGLSLTGKRSDLGLASSLGKEEGNRALVGGSSLLDVGDMKGDEQISI